MTADNKHWIISNEEAIRQLQSTRLNFLKYGDLVDLNGLDGAMAKIDTKVENSYGMHLWNEYVSGELEMDVEAFGRFFLANIDPEETVILITDPGQMKGITFRFLVKELVPFAEWYTQYMKSEFYDFSQYTVIFPNLNTVRFYHDEGVLYEYIIN